jgi:hypothetical protein
MVAVDPLLLSHCLRSSSNGQRDVILVIRYRNEASCRLELTHPKRYCRPIHVFDAIRHHQGCDGGGSAGVCFRVVGGKEGAALTGFERGQKDRMAAGLGDCDARTPHPLSDFLEQCC